MTTVFLACFFTGFGLAILAFISGLDKVTFFDRMLHGHHIGLHHTHHGGAVHKPAVRARRGSAISSLNMAALTAFLAWFGGAGMALQQATKLPVAIVTALASVSGYVGAHLINRFMRALVRSERNAMPMTWAGTIAKVTMPIRAGDGTGEIVFLHDGTRQVAGARSDTGVGIDKGAEVIVTRYERGIAYVCTWEELPASPLEH